MAAYHKGKKESLKQCKKEHQEREAYEAAVPVEKRNKEKDEVKKKHKISKKIAAEKKKLREMDYLRG